MPELTPAKPYFYPFKQGKKENKKGREKPLPNV